MQSQHLLMQENFDYSIFYEIWMNPSAGKQQDVARLSLLHYSGHPHIHYGLLNKAFSDPTRLDMIPNKQSATLNCKGFSLVLVASWRTKLVSLRTNQPNVWNFF